jgi:hypothetical protein
VSVDRVPARLERLRQIARVWDALFPLPLLNRRIGLDALVGLIPGIGDVAGALVASWGLVVAARLRAPASVLARMLVNIGLDALIGAIPLLGDIFDIGWHAQTRNVALLERWLADPDRARRQSAAVLVALAGGLVVVIVAALWLAVKLVVLLIDG